MMDHFSLRPPGPAHVPDGYDELSDREREVLAPHRRRSFQLEIAEGAVHQHGDGQDARAHIFAKLDLRDRAQAVVVARDAGL
jgi:hypothetical protein